MKKIDFKQPRYIFPLIAFFPIVFLVYNVANMFKGKEEAKGVVTDSINTALPEADPRVLDNKLAEMNKAQWGDDNYTAVTSLGEEETEDNTPSQGYSEAELDQLDRINAQKEQEAKEREELNRALAESRRHVNSYRGSSSTGSYSTSSPSKQSTTRSQYEEMEAYAQALEDIQNRNQRVNSRNYEDFAETATAPAAPVSSSSQPAVLQPKPEIVYKKQEVGADRFHTLTAASSSSDASLIKAIIDQTTKARNGTRLRFKLLDDVTIKGVSLSKGTYLYGTVTGFGQQRVMASITSILIKDKFVKVSLSVYDNDGMEGFYVPESMFRSFMKDASASSINNNVNINSNSSSTLSGETLALQALQNLYNSATNAVSNNIRQDKARIKYNTTVYLINSSQNEN